jgi:hypothetical protein
MDERRADRETGPGARRSVECLAPASRPRVTDRFDGHYAIDMNALARVGATARLTELRQELANLHAAFPVLDGASAPRKRRRRTRKAAPAVSDNQARTRKGMPAAARKAARESAKCP